jgi:hypothetical protein
MTESAEPRASNRRCGAGRRRADLDGRAFSFAEEHRSARMTSDQDKSVKDVEEQLDEARKRSEALKKEIDAALVKHPPKDPPEPPPERTGQPDDGGVV